MKRPRPSAPPGVPPGTVQLGGPIDWFSASLNISAENLDPAEVTRLLGAEPTRSQTKGIPILRPDGTVRTIPRFGRWTRVLKPDATDEWNISEVVYLLFAGLPANLEPWCQLAQSTRIRVSLGLSMPASNREFEFDAGLLRFLADRGASIWFDIYDKDSGEVSTGRQAAPAAPLALRRSQLAPPAEGLHSLRIPMSRRRPRCLFPFLPGFQSSSSRCYSSGIANRSRAP
ncbi:MAG: DUF4279 domain-containing protein [Rubrivivax sp.]